MSRYRQNAASINRVRKPGKLVDGSGLFFQRNKDGTLTAWQRVRLPGGKDRDVKVGPPHLDDVTADWLLETRRRAHVLKTARQGAGAPTGAPFSEVWKRYTAAVEKWSDKTRANYDTRMKRYVGPARMWSLPIGAVTVLDVEDAVTEARKERPLLASRVLLDVRAVFTWAIARGEATENPAASYLASLRHIEKRPKPSKLPALVEIKALRKVLATIETSNLFGSLRHALLLQAYTAQRSGSVVSARWQDLNIKARTWTIPRADMKQDDVERGDMVVPLNRPAVALLAKLPKNVSPWVFPAPSNPEQHVAEPQMARALQRLGYFRLHCPHGWRSSIKTVADGALGGDGRPLFAPRWVEDLLDHTVGGVQAHYSRKRAQAGMAKVLAWWGDQLAGTSR